MAVKSMAMASGGNSLLRQGAGTEFYPPRLDFGDDGGYGTFRGRRLIDLGFSRDGAFMGEGAESEAARGAQTTPRRGQRGAHAWPWSGRPVAPLRLPPGLLP